MMWYTFLRQTQRNISKYCIILLGLMSLWFYTVKSGPSSVSVNKVFDIQHANLVIIVYGWLHTTIVELISDHRDNMACNANLIFRKSLLTSDLVDVIIICCTFTKCQYCSISCYFIYMVYLIKLAMNICCWFKFYIHFHNEVERA